MGDWKDWGYIYNVEESEIFVSNAPKKLSRFSEIANAATNDTFDADAYISVTDVFSHIPQDKYFLWFPWNETKMPTPELWYACNKSLFWFVQKKVKKIRLFCDAGTHRSVSVFGAFLYTYYLDDAHAIVANRKGVNRDDKHSDPLDYMDGYLKDFPEDRLFLNEMREDRHHGNLSLHCENIVKRVANRFGKNNTISCRSGL